MGRESEEEMTSLLLYKEAAMIICILIPLILYKFNLLSLFCLLISIVSIITIFVIAGDKLVQLAASKRRKTCKPTSSISNCLSRKKHSNTLSGACTETRGSYSVDGLFVSAKVISKGSNGSVVFEGVYEGRDVAVKRLVKAFHNEALKEVQYLIASDQHPNIARWHSVKHDKDYVYLAVERCICSLSDLISISHSQGDWLISLCLLEALASCEV